MLDNTIQKAVLYLQSYSVILKGFAALRFPFHAKYTDGGETHYLLKHGADLPWLLNKTVVSDTHRYNIASWSMSSLADTCRFRGGRILEISNPNIRRSIENICAQLSCSHTAQATYATLGSLFFPSGNLVNEEISKKWRKLFYDSQNSEVEKSWNAKPWYLVVFHPENQGRYQFYFSWKSNELTFPQISEIRLFCEMGQNSPQGRAAKLLLDFSNDIETQIKTESEMFQRQLAEINEVIDEFNKNQKEKIKQAGHEHCATTIIELVAEDRLFEELREQLVFSPSQLNFLIERIRPLYSMHEFYLPKQQDILARQVRLVPYLNQLEGFLEKYFLVCERMTDLVEAAFLKLPPSGDNLTLTDAFGDFQGENELEVISGVAGIGLLSIVINLGIGCAALIARHLRKKGMHLNLDCCGCLVRPPVQPISLERTTEKIPLRQTEPQPGLPVGEEEESHHWPALPDSPWPRNLRNIQT